MKNKTYSVPAKKLEVKYSADVVVCGGGTAGVFAAVSAAKEGKNTIIIEQFGSLGGTSTNGLVIPLMSVHIKDEPQGCSVNTELNEILSKIDGVSPNGRNFDPDKMRYALEKLSLKYGVKILYHHFITGVIKESRKINGIIAVSKSGEYVIEGKEFIDCTGDADVCVKAGCEYSKGNPETGECQPISLRYLVSGINIPEFASFILDEIKRTGVNAGCSSDGNYSVYGACTGTGNWTFADLFNKGIENGDIPVEDKLYWQFFTVPGRNDTLAFNNPEFFENVDGTNAEHLTEAQIKGKERIFNQLKFYKKYFKGFENAYIAEIASMVGVRETINIVAKYVLTAEDIMGKKKFSDAIAQTNYPIDVHGRQLSCKHVDPVDDGKPWYDIPYGSTVAKEFDNLFVAGRCVGAEFVAEASLRIQPTCRAIGEAVGVAASLCIDGNIPSGTLDGRKIVEVVKSRGGIYAE